MAKDVDKRMDSIEETVQNVIKSLYLIDGMCPNCHCYVGKWEQPKTEFVQRALTDQGINFKTGHRLSCR
jgi:hypothetical protein